MFLPTLYIFHLNMLKNNMEDIVRLELLKFRLRYVKRNLILFLIEE